jgi:hypothetical protein
MNRQRWMPEEGGSEHLFGSAMPTGGAMASAPPLKDDARVTDYHNCSDNRA